MFIINANFNIDCDVNDQVRIVKHRRSIIGQRGVGVLVNYRKIRDQRQSRGQADSGWTMEGDYVSDEINVIFKIVQRFVPSDLGRVVSSNFFKNKLGEGN